MKEAFSGCIEENSGLRWVKFTVRNYFIELIHGLGLDVEEVVDDHVVLDVPQVDSEIVC